MRRRSPAPSPDTGANAIASVPLTRCRSDAGAKYILRHNVTNIRFESVSPTETTVASYFLVVTRKGLDHVGRYRDRMVPVGENG